MFKGSENHNRTFPGQVPSLGRGPQAPTARAWFCCRHSPPTNPTRPPLHITWPLLPSPPALCQGEEVGKESGSILWPQSPGVARLLPAGKREFGEISAADVPDNTVKRQRQQGLCLPDEKVPPPPPTTGLHGAIPGVLPGPHQSKPELRGPRVHL